MSKVSEAELRLVISAAENRRVLDFPRQGHSSEVLANQRKLAERLRPLLTKGLELEKIDKIVADNESERRQLLEKEKADAYERLPRIEDTFRHGIDARFKAFELANSATISPPTFIVLDAPSYIHVSPAHVETASHIEPRNSTVQLKYVTQQQKGTGVTVAFYFLWENLSPDPVVLSNFASQLVIKGYWEVDAASSIFSNVNESEILAYTQPYLIEWWNNPPTQLYGPVNAIVELRTDGHDAPAGAGYNTAWEWVFNSYNVDFSQSLAVPSKGRLLFRVGLITTTWIVGDTNFAFITVQGGDSSILCPFLQFEAREATKKGPPLF